MLAPQKNKEAEKIQTTTQKDAVVTFLKRQRKYVNGNIITRECGPSALRALRKARSEGTDVAMRKLPNGTFQYRIG